MSAEASIEPWNETWVADGDHVELISADGKRVIGYAIRYVGGCNECAPRARFAAMAPELYRTLERLTDAIEHNTRDAEAVSHARRVLKRSRSEG